MKKQPRFIKNFSKENFPEERQEAAEEIKNKRQEYFQKKRKREELERSIEEREHDLAEKLELLESLECKIEEISTSKFKKLLNYLQFKKLQDDMASQKATYEQLKREQEEDMEEKQELEDPNSEKTSNELQEAKEMLDEFYETQQTYWESSEFKKEDITENFSEENLASLSLEEYALLLKRFPEEMVTHVTRQGIRDHMGHEGHNVGEGKYFDGFMKMLEDGRLRSPLGISLMEKEKKKAIADHLQLEEWETKEEALEWLNDSIVDPEQSEPGSYADRRAIHVAAEEVADAYYGSEKGNEIFIAYPSAYIASQYYFQGCLTKAGGGKHNDQWIYANEEQGMNLDTGLVFIPEETQVDKNTGSRYELDEDNNPITNSEYIEICKKIINSDDFYNIAQEAKKITKNFSRYAQDNFSKLWDIKNLPSNDKKLLEELAPLCKKLEQEFGVTDPKLQLTILDFHNLTLAERNSIKEDNSEQNETIEKILKEGGIFYKEAQDTISSKDFWEKYFDNHPQQRPSKIVYYKGEDPTRALHRWKDEAGIKNLKKEGEEEVSQMFSENKVDTVSPQATKGIDRFKSMAEKIIEDYYEQK